MSSATVEKVWNGYLVRAGGLDGKTMVFKTLEETLNELLSIFEGRAKCFGGNLYGNVVVDREH